MGAARVPAVLQHPRRDGQGPGPSRRQLWGGLAVFVLGVVPLLVVKFRAGYVPGDLMVYRHAGSLALRRVGPYAVGFGNHLRVRLPFTYPPFAALAVIPLALAPARLTLVAWTAINLSIVAGTVWWLVRPSLVRAGLDHPAYTGAAAGAAAWTVPAAQTIAYGQVNLALMALVLCDCLLLERRRGVLTGLATAIKLTPGLFILYFVASRQWAAAVRAGVVAVAAELLAAAVLPQASWRYWTLLWLNPRRTGNPGVYFNQSLYGAVLRLGLPHGLWVLLAVAAAALGIWRASRAHRAGAEVAALAIVGLTAVLVSPISWQHHAVWIIPMFAVLAARATTRARRWGVLGALLLFIAPVPQIGDLLLGGPFPSVLARVIQQSDLLIYVGVLAFLPLVPVLEPGGDDAKPAPGSRAVTTVPDRPTRSWM